MTRRAKRYGLLAAGMLAPLGLAVLADPAAAQEAAGSIVDRFITDLTERPDGPMSFRFILQPVMATLAAYRDGVLDAKTGRSPYFWTVLTDPGKRRARLAEGFKSTGKIIAIGLAMDLVYQLLVFKTFHPGEAIVVALILAFLPYLLLRGPIARIARRRLHLREPEPSHDRYR